jgi:hypothetical protein
MVTMCLVWDLVTDLQDSSVDNVHEQHGLEQGVRELRFGLKELASLLRLGHYQCLNK